jgi:hypothetical protein
MVTTMAMGDAWMTTAAAVSSVAATIKVGDAVVIAVIDNHVRAVGVRCGPA